MSADLYISTPYLWALPGMNCLKESQPHQGTIVSSTAVITSQDTDQSSLAIM